MFNRIIAECKRNDICDTCAFYNMLDERCIFNCSPDRWDKKRLEQLLADSYDERWGEEYD